MRARAAVCLLALAVAGFASVLPWQDLTESDWVYALATRFTQVDGHRVHYPTPTAELARLLETRQDPAALRHLAEARLALGDRSGALGAMRRWAGEQGPAAWAEFARWAAARQEPAVALEAAGRALPGLPEAQRRALADERVAWAERHPELGDPIALIQARSELFPDDGAALERWVRALERAGRLDEAQRALAGSRALGAERRLLLGADLLADHGDRKGAFQLLDGAVGQSWSMDFRKAYAARVDQAAPGAPAAWRATLEARFDGPALVRLATWFQGRAQGGSAADLLRQVERRHGAGLERPGRLLLVRLYGEIDAVPEAFREALAAAHAGTPEQQTGDLAALAGLALRAGGRPLAWGNYNDEAYRWVANLDRTPGFWTGGVSFLFTGAAWQDTLARLEAGSVPERTFATARALAGALAERAPGDPALPGLRVAIMERHVELGEGRAALALLPLVEGAGPALADEARRVALLAAQSAPLPRAEEARLFKARLCHAAPDGSGAEGPAYRDLLNGALARMDELDPTHRAALDLILGELDRLPDAEQLWLDLASRLEGWNLDDDLGPRLQRALDRFQGPGAWARAARWYARRKYQAELRRLAADVAARFRGSALFERADAAGVSVAVTDPGSRVRLVPWADWVRLQALERFPHSPEVFREAGRLMPASVWEARHGTREAQAKVVVPDALLRDRRWALLYADPGVREAWFREAMRSHTLEARLEAMESGARTPVQDCLLFEGWARLSRFERAVAPADRLALSYPGDADLAQRTLALHRSLNGLGASQVEAARALVARTAPALEDAAPLWTELGEMEEERGRPGEAMALWRNLLAREPRDPGRIARLATLLWDYGHDREALDVLEAGRKALGRPRFLAFECGVLRENLRDLEGAVREYLDAVRPEDGADFGSRFYNDQRSLRRLAQLLSRDRVFRLVAGRVQRLAPGRAEDERTLAAFFPLGGIQPQAVRDWDDDAWIDRLDHPADPTAQAGLRGARQARRPAEAEAVGRMGGLLLDKLREMVPKATSLQLLAFADGEAAFMGSRWPGDQVVGFQDLVLARKAELAPSVEERVDQEIRRAQWLAGNGRVGQADAVWAGLAPRIQQLPEGAARIQAEAQRAGYLERAKGSPAAAGEWRRLSQSHPWSLGLLEDRLAFLARAGLDEEGRALLEQSAARAGAGYREDLLRRLAHASMEAGDLPRARRAAEQLLATAGLADHDRLAASHLLARLSFRAGSGGPAALAAAQEAQLRPENRAELYRQLAQAADLEHAPALGLWIEALNRRTDPYWLREAARSGHGPGLLDFFRGQRERSPRDVRWIVAVRDLRQYLHDVPGAIEAAEAAVRVRPDDQELWRAAADLLARAGRVREAADFLAEWNRPRPADEGAAHWRAGLYSQAGDPGRALAVEQDALAAFAREAPGRRDELAGRAERATERLSALGLPGQALRLLAPGGDAARLPSRLAPDRQAELALRAGQLPRLLEAHSGDPEFLAAAGTVFLAHRRPEQVEAVQARLVQLLIPAGRLDSAALARWWPFIDAAGLEDPLRPALARRLLGARPGPWQADPPFPLVQAAGADLLRNGPDERPVFREPDLSRLWCAELARRGLDDQLLAYTAPRWRELMLQVKGAAPVSAEAEPLPWASWLQDPGVLQAWARAAAARPGMVGDLAEAMGERPRWDRFWALAARRWEAQPLVAALPEPARLRWFGFWEPAADPAQRERRRSVEQVGLALGRLLQGAPSAGADPLVARLRGPATVGGVLGRNPRWTWPEFAPLPADQGDDRVEGQGADRGRLPGQLWGEHAAPAWYVLETLARYRQGDPSAARVALAAPRAGAETQRAILALRLARALGDQPLALELGAAGPARDRQWLEARLKLLAAAQRAPEAWAAFQAYLRSVQATLTETSFRDLAGLAGRLGLPGPLAWLDPGQPVGPAFLAYLQDLRPADAPRFRTLDPMGYRSALAQRWQGRAESLTPGQLRLWLEELWARGEAGLPAAGLARLGPVWPYTIGWLEARPVPERPAALGDLEQALDRKGPGLPGLARPEHPDDWRRLALRIRQGRGETGPALAMLEARLGELGGGRGLAPEAHPPSADPEDDPGTASWDALPATLQAWLDPFGDSPAARDKVRGFLARRRAAGRVSAREWRLALRLCPGGQAAGLLTELEAAWFRADLDPADLPLLLPAMAAAAPAAVPGWLARCPDDFGGPRARLVAGVLVTLRRPEQAARTLVEARRRGFWSAADETEAFDLWRRLALPPQAAPAYWQGALAAWRGQDLDARLKAHPADGLAARSALGSLGPLDEDAAARADVALQGADRLVLDVRRGRGLLARSPGAAWTLLGAYEPADLARRLAELGYPPEAVDAALADRARAAAQAGDAAGVQAVLATLAERGTVDLKALAARLPAPKAKADPFRLVEGRPAPIRPRDLTWSMVVRMLTLEGAP